jgi:hypothetical protein
MVVDSSLAGKGVPAVVLEERHNSRLGQVQHAITLLRLHDKYGMSNIALEGYLKDDVPIHTDWFGRAAEKSTPEARARVAVQFLKQGEISAAEFMALVYPEIRLLPTETANTYNAGLPRGIPTESYLKKISAVDPAWAEEKGKAYESEESIMRLTGDEHLALAKEIKQYAETNSIPITSSERRDMDKFIEFWEKRMSSNNLIADAVAGAPSASGSAVVAANVGAFHTQGVCRLLSSSGHPYAVVRPLYAPDNPTRGDLTDAMYQRKNNRQPVFSSGLSALVLSQVSIKNKKYQPVISQPFFEAEAEIYDYVETISKVILSPPNPPGLPNGGNPPFGLSGDEFDGKWISINPTKIVFMPSNDDRHKAVLIPIMFKNTKKTIWVGAFWGHGLEAGQTNVEEILQHALHDILTEPSTPQRAESSAGFIQMSPNTFAVIGRDKEGVRRSILENV